MRYKKFEKVRKRENPIIRITFINFWGKEIVKDVIKCRLLPNNWVFMESGDLTHNNDPITTFHNGEDDEWIVNESN